MVDAEGRGDGADLPVLAVIEAANLGVLLGRDHGGVSGDTRRIRQGGGRSQALSRPQTMHRDAPARGAVGTSARRRVRRQCGEGGGPWGSLIPHAGAVGALVIAMIEAAFGTAAMTAAAARTESRRAAVATRRRAIGVAAITGAADREERLQRRQIFWRSGASTASERRHASTGHGAQTVAQERRLARSVGASRRSPRAWRDKLQVFTSLVAARQPTAIHRTRTGRSAAATPHRGAIATAAERLLALR